MDPSQQHEYGLNISTPVSGEGNLLYVAPYDDVTQLLKLAQAGGKTTVQELWTQNRVRAHIGTVVAGFGDFCAVGLGQRAVYNHGHRFENRTESCGRAAHAGPRSSTPTAS